tara:strand:- start:626 stop:817 length:192 start_codon:yes stop_codon:yes gene_type:complete
MLGLLVEVEELGVIRTVAREVRAAARAAVTVDHRRLAALQHVKDSLVAHPSQTQAAAAAARAP